MPGKHDAAVDSLSRALHEASQEQQEKGLTFDSARAAFVEWERLPERVRRGWKLQARHLLDRYTIIPRGEALR